MPLSNDNISIHLITDKLEESLEDFSDRIRHDEGTWRCFSAHKSDGFHVSRHNITIFKEFIKGEFAPAESVDIFFTNSGHLFLFLKGTVKAPVKCFEHFLKQVCGTDSIKHIDYEFFWELDHFWGFFDETLARITLKKTASIAGLRYRKQRKRPLLLILEDDRTDRTMLQAIMRKYCDIAISWNGEQARTRYLDLRPNIAFLDLQVPFGDGEDLAADICKKDPEAFVVIISGALTPNKIERCMKAGVKACVPKPINEKAVLTAFAQYLEEQTKKQQKKNQS